MFLLTDDPSFFIYYDSIITNYPTKFHFGTSNEIGSNYISEKRRCPIDS